MSVSGCQQVGSNLAAAAVMSWLDDRDYDPGDDHGGDHNDYHGDGDKEDDDL